MLISPVSREELERRAKDGDAKAIQILESLEATDQDPFCHASGKNCPAVNYCSTSQAAKTAHEKGEKFDVNDHVFSAFLNSLFGGK